MPSPLPSTAVLMDLLRLNVTDHPREPGPGAAQPNRKVRKILDTTSTTTRSPASDKRLNHVTSDIAGAARDQDGHAMGPLKRSATAGPRLVKIGL
jgi:hypothetical protein